MTVSNVNGIVNDYQPVFITDFDLGRLNKVERYEVLSVIKGFGWVRWSQGMSSPCHREVVCTETKKIVDIPEK